MNETINKYLYQAHSLDGTPLMKPVDFLRHIAGIEDKRMLDTVISNVLQVHNETIFTVPKR